VELQVLLVQLELQVRAEPREQAGLKVHRDR
jgi:hypothetical protein